MDRRGPYQDVTESVLEYDSRLLVIEDIKRYGNTHKSFDMEFVTHVESCLMRRGYVTVEHYTKLLNIFYAYFMDKKQYSLQKETKVLDCDETKASASSPRQELKPLENL